MATTGGDAPLRDGQQRVVGGGGGAAAADGSYDMYLPGRTAQRYHESRAMATSAVPPPRGDGAARDAPSQPVDDDHAANDDVLYGEHDAPADYGDLPAVSASAAGDGSAAAASGDEHDGDSNDDDDVATASDDKRAHGRKKSTSWWAYLRYVVYFVSVAAVTFALLMLINPPFVHTAARVDAHTERVPSHVGKVLAYSLLAGLLATLAPLAWTHLRPLCTKTIDGMRAKMGDTSGRGRSRTRRKRRR